MLLSGLLQAVFVAVSVTCASAARCTSDEQCYPTGYVADGIDVPRSSIYCSANGECVCRNCFYLQKEKERCAVDASCSTSDKTADETSYCPDDRRRSRVRAALVAGFFGFVGAANFYIARYEYAVPQLVLFLFLSALISFIRIILRHHPTAMDDNRFAGCFVVTVVVTCFVGLIVFAWWVADIVIFATNKRRDGDNCPLG